MQISDNLKASLTLIHTHTRASARPDIFVLYNPCLFMPFTWSKHDNKTLICTRFGYIISFHTYSIIWNFPLTLFIFHEWAKTMNGGERHKKNAQARNPPKAKMKALPRTPWTIKTKIQADSTVSRLQGYPVMLPPYSLFLGNISAMQWTTVNGDILVKSYT